LSNTGKKWLIEGYARPTIPSNKKSLNIGEESARPKI
jgi:hypothetical protein